MDKMTKTMIKAATKGDDRSDYFHSSGYAKAQSGRQIGAASSGQTFKQRQAMKREFINKYSDSTLHRSSLNTQPQPKKVDPE